MWVENSGSKTEGYSRFWFENYDGILVSPWKRYNIIITRKIIRQMGLCIIGRAEFGNNWSMIIAEKFLYNILKYKSESIIVCGSN